MRIDGERLVSLTGAAIAFGNPSGLSVDSVTSDSRSVRPGCAFVAIQGTRVDGHAFAAAAVQAGAAVIIGSRPLDPAVIGDVPELVVSDPRQALSVLAAELAGNPTAGIELTGVVGTDGKTSTTLIIEAGLKGCGRTTGLLGTVQYRYAGKVIESSMTTPDPVTLQDLFARMRDAGVDAAVMEVSSHAIDQRRVESCRFKYGVFTNLGRDHLDYHVTLDAYREAKLRFFTEVLPSNPDAVGSVVNDDDPVSSMIRERSPLPVIGWTFGGCQGSEIRLVKAEYSFDGTMFEVETPWGRFEVRTSLIGRHNVANIMAAIGVAGVAGLDIGRFIAGIAALTTIPGRLERVRPDAAVKVFVDYAHTPRAIESVLAILGGIDGSARLHVVCGAGGDRDRGKRPLMGAAAVMNADVAWITSDNPRSEDPSDIIGQIVDGIRQAEADGGSRARWEVEPDRREAIRKAISGARHGDVVLIAGKGHENYQILKDRTIHFSDVEVAGEMLER
ncbi:MAG TPA: UDP-N-acetylmuramoyl-L-alanyl-D-glutamate--2,6-diaminopimelate ligase [Myxococcota bacterium]|nr:UDP-N-acetylmuramoyl-L-alanyl-D-glutamate--2,6-diaminopimelate ligase [Myxococcota bacterium]HOH76190.1 UDP-N-acetylmuramoyl-L-alanyl-D-glutamate--2,6-diaminopimelate ligase [Myxococcota bacterium]